MASLRAGLPHPRGRRHRRRRRLHARLPPGAALRLSLQGEEEGQAAGMEIWGILGAWATVYIKFWEFGKVNIAASWRMDH